MLTGGAALLCHAAYTGTDYSGRFGNFYAHALYLPGGPGDLGPVLPIDTWVSASWRTGPPAVAMPAANRMEPGEAITRETLLAFTRQRHDQLAAVLTDIMNSFGRRGPQVVLAEDQSEAVAQWIAVACRSLPPALARRLTFTTYTRRPHQSSHQVIGITPGADFSFTHTELTAQYRVYAEPGRSSPWAEPMPWRRRRRRSGWTAGRNCSMRLTPTSPCRTMTPRGMGGHAGRAARRDRPGCRGRSAAGSHGRRCRLGYRPYRSSANPIVLAGPGRRHSPVFRPDPSIRPGTAVPGGRVPPFG